MRRARAATIALLGALALLACNSILGIESLGADAGADAGADVASIDATQIDAASDAGSRESGSPDAATCITVPPSYLCGVSPQCGCGGGTCEVTFAGGAHCIDAGAIAEGKLCDDDHLCAPGLTCFFGICHSYCAKPGVACPSSAVSAKCVAEIDPNNPTPTPIPNMNICEIDCELTDPSSCGASLDAAIDAPQPGCQLDFMNQATDCTPMGPNRKLCQNALDCSPGFVCDHFVCRRWCRVGKDDCDGGICQPQNPPDTLGATEYGACH
jgi:hypothetical protein